MSADEASDAPVTEARRRLMQSVRRKNTSAELRVRSLLHRLGFRFRIHVKSLPGTPDIVLPKWNTIIFVNGCFWHRHPDCQKASTPRSRESFWAEKFRQNIERDRRKQTA